MLTGTAWAFIIAIGAGVIALARFGDSVESLWKRGKKLGGGGKPPKLQYHSVQATIGYDWREPATTEIIVHLNNPHDRVIRVFVQKTETTFGNHTSQMPSTALAQLDVGAHTVHAVVRGQAVPIRYTRGRMVEGRIHFALKYDWLKEDGTCDFSQTLEVRGGVLIEFLSKDNARNGYYPDPGTEVPMVLEERLVRVDENGDFHSR